MEEKKVDKRTLKTRKAIINALAELLSEKELRKITVQEIADGADVNRVTFYKHYLDIYDLYEQTMVVEVQLQDTLAKYASAQDLLCATIGNEVRGMAEAQQIEDQWLFFLVVGSNDVGVNVGLSYYCDKLHRIFSIQWTRFDATVPPTGQGGIYQPDFVK